MKNKCVCTLCLLQQILLLKIIKLNIWYARYLLAEHLGERLQHKGEQQGGGRRKASANVFQVPTHMFHLPLAPCANECLTSDRCLNPKSPRVLLVRCAHEFYMYVQLTTVVLPKPQPHG